MGRKTKIIATTITMPMDFPDDWDDDMIEFNLNESSWCFGNFLDQLNEYAQQHDGCICNLCEARVVKDEIK